MIRMVYAHLNEKKNLLKCWQQRIESETIIIMIITTKGTLHRNTRFNIWFSRRSTDFHLISNFVQIARMLWISFVLMFQCYFNGWIAVCAVYWFIWFPYSNALLFLNVQYKWLSVCMYWYCWYVWMCLCIGSKARFNVSSYKWVCMCVVVRFPNASYDCGSFSPYEPAIKTKCTQTSTEKDTAKTDLCVANIAVAVRQASIKDIRNRILRSTN